MHRLFLACFVAVCLAPCAHSDEGAIGVPAPTRTLDDAASEKVLALEKRIAALEARPVPVPLGVPAGPVLKPTILADGRLVPGGFAVLGEAIVSTTFEPRIGDRVLLDLVDRPAVAYMKFIGVAHVPEPRQVGVPLEATVIKIEDNMFLAEYTAMGGRNTNSPKLITVTAEGEISELRNFGNVVAVPEEGAPAWVNEARRRQAAMPRLRIENLDKAVIREWTLSRTVDD